MTFLSRAVQAIFFLTCLLCTRSTYAIVNGVVTSNSDFRAVVFVDITRPSDRKRFACTGTFVHPYLVLTARHCIDGIVRNSDGPLTTVFVTDGVSAGTGAQYPVDYVYFAEPSDLSASERVDVAILRTTRRFNGKILPVMPSQDLPKPDESNYCKRYEYTWPFILGYSDNADTDPSMRRLGRTFAECDIERDGTIFKLDGHGRDSQRGVRNCDGDSGGPVVWEDGFGEYAVGGVISMGEIGWFITNRNCPSRRGEVSAAFIPTRFLNRVASLEPRCGRSGNWESCTGIPQPYDGQQLRYLGTDIDQCSKSTLRVASVYGDVAAHKGRAASAEIDARKFTWFCGNSRERTKAERGANFLIFRRGLTDRQTIWDSYSIISR